jgi:hypothetical protein
VRKLIFALTSILFVFLSGFTIQNSSTKKISKTAAQLQELNNPLQYLTTDVMVKANLILTKKESVFNDAEYKNDGYLIEGAIKNTADSVHFKNIVFRVNFYSTTQKKIGSKDYILNQYYKPHTSNFISLKVYPPKGYVEFDFEIVDASGV